MRRVWIVIFLIVMLACASLPPTITPRPEASRIPAPASQATPTVEPTMPGPPPPSGNLASLAIDDTAPFSTQVTLSHWTASATPPQTYSLPLQPNTISNFSVAAGLTASQMNLLIKNGFTVLHSQEAQFSDIRHNVADQYGQPYYLTTDAAYHALHVTFDELLKALETGRLRPQMIDVTRATLDEVLTYQKSAQQTVIGNDINLAAAYLAVGLKLLDPQAVLAGDLAKRIQPQLDQIKAGRGAEDSVLIPNFRDDYAAYKPVGHYTASPEMEAYFQGMTWFERVNFLFQDPARPGFTPSRLPLIVTLALRQATDPDGPEAENWVRVHETLTFLIGPSDDPGPAELATLMDQVYGTNLSVLSLSDSPLWKQFLQRSSALPAPQVNSVFVPSSQALQGQRSWRFLGQRFALDAFILQNMLYDKVGTPAKQRLAPSGLDVMAALGSQAALNAQAKAGETSYQNYLEQMAAMQKVINSQSEVEWLNPFYSAWLYAFIPQVATKDAAYPPAMRTDAWGYKDLNSALASWAELKHDTTLYTKRPEPMGGGGPPGSPPAPAYVEPEPDVFYRLAYLAQALVKGLEEHASLPPQLPQAENPIPGPLTLDTLLAGMSKLGDTFQQFGQIAANELSGRLPTSEDERALIDSCLGPVECYVLQAAQSYGQPAVMPPVPVVSAVSGAGEQFILEAATGYVDRIYVTIPTGDGSFQLAQGGIFSYYEFLRPRSDPLTDARWRDQITQEPADSPAWTLNFLLPVDKGFAAGVLAMRIGDVYKITPAGGDPPLILRGSPSRAVPAITVLRTGDYFEIADGPLKAEGITWWKVKDISYYNAVGWIAENLTWYERAYGQ
jgi:hypothetical protein